jgi:hypothetical protein
MEHPSHQNEEDLLFKRKERFRRNEQLYYKGVLNWLVDRGHFEKNANDHDEIIMVKKIKVTDCDDQWEDIFSKHTGDAIKHENVLKIIGCKEEYIWR